MATETPELGVWSCVVGADKKQNKKQRTPCISDTAIYSLQTYWLSVSQQMSHKQVCLESTGRHSWTENSFCLLCNTELRKVHFRFYFVPFVTANRTVWRQEYSKGQSSFSKYINFYSASLFRRTEREHYRKFQMEKAYSYIELTKVPL